MAAFEPFLNFLQNGEYFGNSLHRWLVALGIAIGVGCGLWLTKRLLVRHATRLAEAHPSGWLDAVADLLRHTSSWFLWIMAAYGAAISLTLPTKAVRIVSSVAILALLVQAALWGDSLIRFFLLGRAKRRVETDASSATTLVALGFLGRMAVWTLATLLALANLGIDVTAMVAGLGIGGVAVALAAQNVLGDLFASASIVLDKPFVLGDFIIVGEDMGTVEHIGLKTTRLRSLAGEQLIFANNDLLKSRIRNMKRMAERRVVFAIGVTYQTPVDKLAAIPAMIRTAVESQSPVRFDRAHFKQYGDFSLVFEVVYFVLAADYNLSMDIQQAINLAIFRRFAEERIEFAYPTHTVHLQRPD